MNISDLMQVTQGNRSIAAAKNLDKASQLGADGNISSSNTSRETANSASDVAASTAAATADRTREEFDTFLTLLTAQIKNQDPLAPLDSTQFVEQLATFSNLELQAEGNQTLTQIATLLNQSINGQNFTQANNAKTDSGINLKL